MILDEIVKRALCEDIRSGDLSTQGAVSPLSSAQATLWSKSEGVIAGLGVVRQCFWELDPNVTFTPSVHDGKRVRKNTLIAEIAGNAHALLSAERVALNFLQRLSGIATETRKLVDAISPHSAQIIDTRKTTPGLRMLEKYAVRMGGGQNHRFALDDAVLLKENHIAAAGGIIPAIKKTRNRVGHTTFIQVEVSHLTGLEDALEAGVDAILLDNMTLDELREAVQQVNGRVILEASGNITLVNAADIAATGVDLLSVGYVTHSPKALDVSLILERIL